jgi:hypothetical protein
MINYFNTQKVFLFSIILLNLTLSIFAQSFDPKKVEYLWPTNADIYLSASFGETRFSHFHAGIDVKTWGREGFEIYATRDGYLHRLGVSPFGYGNVIYLKHDDGSVSVYAHLRNFIEPLEQLADSIRLSDYSYRFNETINDRTIRFKKGDLIGYSGSSGSGPAHLHFELRTPTEAPFNPLMTNIKIKDNVKPRFSRISIEPLSRESTVQGRNGRVLRRPRIRSGSFDFGNFKTYGPFGIAVDISDRADDVLNVYAVHSIKLFINDSLYYETKTDSFSYDQTRLVKIDRVYELLNTTRKGYQKLYVSDGNDLPFAQTGSNLRALNLEKGNHDVRIVTTDFSGNVAEATLTIQALEYKPSRGLKGLRTFDPSKISMSVDWSEELFKKWTWDRDYIQTNLSNDDYLGLIGFSIGSAVLHTGLSGQEIIDYKNYDSLQVIGPFGNKATIYVLKPSEKKRDYKLHSSSDAYQLKMPYSAILDTIPLMLLEAKNNGVEIFPDLYPFMDNFELKTTVNQQEKLTEHSIFVQKSANNNESYAGGYFNTKTNELVMSSYMPGTFFISSDTTAPKISALSYYRRKRDRKRLPGFKVSDNLSGIDFNKTAVWLDNVRGIAEYNPDQGVIMYYHPNVSAKSGNILRIRLVDQANNITEVSLPLP